MKKITGIILVLAVVTSCKSLRKNTDGTAGADSQIKSETTASGGSEKIDASPMNFSPTGSDSGSIDGLQTIFFEYDKSTLSETEKNKLAGNVNWLKNNSNVKMAIEGHCDQRGSTEYNLSLGERRANTIKQIMQTMGIAGNRLTTVSFGEEKPLIVGEQDEALLKNRRANFVPSN